MLLRRESVRSLVLLLLRLANHWRFFSKNLLKKPHKFGNACSIPHSGPISQVWMVHSTINSHMLPRPYEHIQTRRDVYNRCLLRVWLRYPYLDWEPVSSSPIPNWKYAGEGEKKSRVSILVGVNFGSRAERRVRRQCSGCI